MREIRKHQAWREAKPLEVDETERGQTLPRSSPIASVCSRRRRQAQRGARTESLDVTVNQQVKRWKKNKGLTLEKKHVPEAVEVVGWKSADKERREPISCE